MTKQRIGLVLGIFVFLFEIQLEKGIVEAGSICFILFVFYVCIQPTWKQAYSQNSTLK